MKCLWSEGAKLLAHGSESFGKIFDRFAVNFQRVGVNCNSFWSHFQKGSLENQGFLFLQTLKAKKQGFHFFENFRKLKKQGFHFLQTLKAKKQGFYFFLQTLKAKKQGF